MTDTMRMAALVLEHDPSALAKLTVALPVANDEWYVQQDQDDAWIEQQAMMENFRHCRMPGE